MKKAAIHRINVFRNKLHQLLLLFKSVSLTTLYSFVPNFRGKGRIKCTRGKIIKISSNSGGCF